jgi:hypothetical protein
MRRKLAESGCCRRRLGKSSCEVGGGMCAVPTSANFFCHPSNANESSMSGELLLAAFVIVPKAFSSVADYFVISKSCAIIVHKRELVWRQDIGLWLSV